MKFSPVLLCIVISAIAIPQIASANTENILTTTGENNQAANLFTKPASINGSWQSNIEQNPNSALFLRDQGCKKVNPLDLINNPSAFFEQCQAATNEQIPYTGEPVDYLKVPRLDSGLNLTVTQF